MIPKRPSRCALLATCLTLFVCSAALGQEAARPARGTMPNRTYSVTDIENVSLQNGNVNLSIPLASLPPIAGGKLSWTVSANYNSKLWNVTREQQNLDPLQWAPYTINTPQLSDLGGWRIGGAYYFQFRNSNEDFYRMQYPGNSGLPYQELYLLNNYQWYKVVLHMPDGSEHEFRRTDTNNSLYTGSEDFLRGYYNVIPTGGPLRYYSVDGSYLFATISSLTDWTVYMPDGTKVVQSADGIQRIQDTNGNKIKIFSDEGGTYYQDEQTGREIVVSQPSTNQTQVTYPTVGGTSEHIDVNWGTTTVQGKLWTTNVNGCDMTDQLATTNMEVVRSIVLPVTEPNQSPRQFSFNYNSDTSSTQVDSALFSCPGGTAESYSRTASGGMGELSQMTTPSGSVVHYSYSLDGNHNFQQFYIDLITEESITEKQVIHDNVTDTWAYAISDSSGSVSNPDGSGFSEARHCSLSGTTCATDYAGLAYRNTRPFMMTERHWTNLKFSGASIDKPGGIISFNPVVDFEYTTLLDANNNPLKMSTKSFQYDYNGNMTQETDYDWIDNVAGVSRDAQGVPIGIPSGATVLRTTNNDYYNQAGGASSGNVYAKRDLTYATPLILSALEQTAITNGSTVQLSYDGNPYGTVPTIGNLTSKSVYDDIDNHWITTSMGYDSYGNVTSTTDGRGKVSTIAYDSCAHAQPVSVTVNPDNGTGAQTSYTSYDCYTGLVTSTTDANNQISTINYTNQLLGSIDPFGRPGVVIAPLVNVNGTNQHHHTTTYYEDHLLRATVATDLYAENDQLLKTRATSDMLGRPILSEQTEDGTNYSIYSRKAYDTVNRVMYSSAPMRYGVAASTDSWTRVTSDLLGRPTEVATFGGASQPASTGTGGVWTGSVTTSYNANTVTVTDQAGKQRQSVSDALSRLTSVFEDPNGLNYQTSYDYDVLGNLRHVYQGAQTRTFTYDSLSRLHSALNPESGTVSYVYDDNGNLTSKTDARSITTNYVYDSLNRVTSRSYANDPNGTPAVSYTYDSASISNGKGRLASVSSSVSSYSYAGYDAVGKVIGATQTIGSQNYAMSYGYTLAGHVKTMTYPSQNTVSYSYDNAGRTNSFTGNLGDSFFRTYATGIGYSALGGMSQEQFGTQTALYHNLDYNPRGQLFMVKLGTSAGNWNRGMLVNNYSTNDNVAWGSSGPDNNGNVLRTHHYVPNDDQISGYSLNYQDYTYDSLNRLSSVTEISGADPGSWYQSYKQSYSYDRYGNRTIDQANTSGNIPRPTFAVDTGNNRLGVPSGQSGTMSYDNAGNLTADTYSGSAVSRAYDAENRMTQETTWNSVVSGRYTYDADGRRVKRQAGNNETWQVYGIDGELLAEYGANGAPNAPQKEYGYRNGQLLITAESGVALAVAPTGLTTAAASSSITLSWSAAAGAANYRIERKGRGTGFNLVTATSSTSVSDNVTPGTAYLYRVCAADGSNNCTSSYSNIALGLAISFTDPNIVGVSENPATATAIKAAHINDLRAAVNAIRYLAIVGDATWTHPTITAQQSVIAVEDVRELRSALNEALTVLHLQTPPFTDPTLVGAHEDAAHATPVRAVHIRELRERATSSLGSSCYKSIEQFVKDFYQGALQRQPNGTELSQATATLESAQASGATALITAAQNLGATLFNSAEYANFGTSNAQYLTDVYYGFLQRAPDTDGYNFWLDQLDNHGYPRASLITAFQTSGEFIENAKALCRTAGGGSTTGSVHWLVADQLGTPRMIVDASGSLATMSRHDYLPFGEELYAGTGGRTTAQGYSASDGVRQKFTGYEADGETGLAFAQTRFYASPQGRFVSVDPFLGSAKYEQPQSWNRYAYCINNPGLYTDPMGLVWGQRYSKEDNTIYVSWYEDTAAMEAAGATAVTNFLIRDSSKGWIALSALSNNYELISDAEYLEGAISGTNFLRQAGFALTDVIKHKLTESVDPVGLTFVTGGMAASEEAEAALLARGVTVSAKGLELIEQHLIKLEGTLSIENALMLARLRSALWNDARATGADASFYLHETSEATMTNRIMAEKGLNYVDAADVAHSQALDKYARYGMSQLNHYHPDVIRSTLYRDGAQNWSDAYLRYWKIKK
jgi:RHS repeat-associated protein